MHAAIASRSHCRAPPPLASSPLPPSTQPAARAAPQDCIPTFTTASAACANVTAKPEPASACCNVWRTVAAECVDQGFTVIAAASGSGSTNGTAPLVTRAQFAGIYQACSLGALPAGDVVARWNSGPTAHCAVWDEDSDEWNDLKGSPWGGVGGVAAPAAPAADWVGIFCNDTLKNSTFYFTQAMQKGGDEALAAVAALELPDYTCGEDDVSPPQLPHSDFQLRPDCSSLRPAISIAPCPLFLSLQDVEPIEDVGVAFVNSEAINSSTIMG